MKLSHSNSATFDKHNWFENPALQAIPVQLTDVLNEVILPSGLKVTGQPCREQESAEYGACLFKLEGKTILFRVANTTATKIGQFVTLWKRPDRNCDIEPIDHADPIDAIFISVFDKENRGIFVFNKQILVKKGIVSANGKGGKRAIRVYAPWVKPISKQAIQTQEWQSPYFFPMNLGDTSNLSLFQTLFKQDNCIV